LKFFDKNRIFSTRLFAVGFVLIILFTSDSWEPNSPIDLIVEWTGYVFLIAAILGRLWCSIYIGGYKNDRVINEGPYSIVRNPLYLFSFLGGIGLALAAENLLILGFIIILFLTYYPSVVFQEEKDLEVKFGQEFIDYKKKTPRWLPQFSSYYEPEQYLVKTKYLKRAMFDSMWFIWFFMFIRIVEVLQDLHYLPVILKIP
jgi:protein-S-isoprenylcysteine O-methyltransferase Ste14